jgi:hypothetical protein
MGLYYRLPPFVPPQPRQSDPGCSEPRYFAICMAAWEEKKRLFDAYWRDRLNREDQ